MNREQAVKYLSFSGFSDEQIRTIEGAFTCDKCVYSTSEGCQYDDITETIPPFEPENAISKQAVFEQIGGWITSGEYEFTNATDYLCKRINSLPPVTPQPKKGHWLLKRTFPTKLYDEYLNEYKCSECYREIRCTESQLVNYPYCHCGRRMVEPQESEEV
jgi:hypothetical protein